MEEEAVEVDGRSARADGKCFEGAFWRRRCVESVGVELKYAQGGCMYAVLVVQTSRPASKANQAKARLVMLTVSLSLLYCKQVGFGSRGSVVAAHLGMQVEVCLRSTTAVG